MNPIKLVAIDIDGTLANHSREITDLNKSAIAILVEKGVIVVLASGRIGWSVQSFQKKVGIENNPAIGTNGCEVFGWNRSIIDQVWLTPTDKANVMAIAREYDLHINGYAPEKLYFSKDGIYAQKYLERVEGAKPIIANYQAIEQSELLKILFFSEPQALDKIAPIAKDKIGSAGCEMTRSEPEYLEFLPKGTSKGAGLKKLCSHLGIGSSEVAAIGDYYNDSEMLQWAGISAAMGNAPDDLKELADYVVADHNSSGVHEFISILTNR